MGDVIVRKLTKYSLLLILLPVIFLAAVDVLYCLWNINQINVNDIRVGANRLVTYIEKVENSMELDDIMEATDTPYDFVVFDDKGTVLATTLDDFPKGQIVNPETIAGKNRVNLIYKQEDGIKGILLIDTTKYQIERMQEKIPYCIVISTLVYALYLFIFYRILRVVRIDVVEPIHQLSVSTESILEGNLDTKVKYDYDGEIGELCKDFDHMREELKDKDKREKQWHEKEKELYASISHDLRTPLAVVKGYLEEIQYDVVTDGDEIKKVTGRSLEKVNLLTKLVDDILEHSKAELNQLKMEKEYIDARDFFEKILKQFENEVENMGGELHYSLPEHMLLYIDSTRIHQVMQNLLGNSMKYVKEDNPLNIEVSFETIDEEKILVTHVKDNGRGIEATDVPFIFDLFYRGNKARTQDIPGSGIGLYTSKYIVEEHDGRMECDSVAGFGTTMSFSLPI